MATRMERAKELIAQKNSISSVAKDLGFKNRDVFSKTFRLQVGVSPTDWLQGSGSKQRTADRVAEAERLLLSGDHSVTSAAKLMGLNSSQALAALFKSVHGVPPSEWLAQKSMARIEFMVIPPATAKTRRARSRK